MLNLKHHVALRTEQATTTKWHGVTTDNISRWHGTVDDTLEDMDRQKSWHSYWEGIKESNKIDIFWWNMDETNMSEDEGKLCRYRVLYLSQL